MDIVKKRIMLLLYIVAALFILGIVGWNLKEQQKLGLLYKQEISEFSQSASKLVELRGEKLANLASDYSCWDDTVNFVKTQDPKWAEINLVPTINNFEIDSIAVYNPSGVKIYSTNSLQKSNFGLPNFKSEQIKHLFSKSPLCHFFIKNRNELHEVRGAKIVPSGNSNHTGPAYGYLFVSRIWNSNYLDEIASLINGKASLHSISDKSQIITNEKKQNFIIFQKQLNDIDGHNIQTLHITKRFEEGNIQKETSRMTITLLGFFAGMVFIILALGLSRLVTYPLRLISSAMENQSSETLSPLESDPSEFGRLATLIHRFFLQKTELELEIQRRIQAEEDIKKSEEHLSCTLHSIGDAVLVTDCNTRIIRMNPIAEILTGWSAEDAFGRPISEVFHIFNARTREPAFNPITHVLATGKNAEIVNGTIIVSKDGIERQIADSCSAVRDNNGCIIGVVLVFRDVTEEYRQRDLLQKSEEKHRLLIENSHDIIYTLDPDGILTFVSSACTTILGYPIDQVVGQPLQQFIHPDDFANCMEFIKSAVKTKQRKQGIEYRLKHIDGSWHWHTTSAVPLVNESGIVVGFEGISRDINDRKLSEDEISFKNALLSAQHEASIDGILAVDNEGKILLFNKQFIEMWGIPPELAKLGMDEPLLQSVASKVVDSEHFLNKVRYLYEHLRETSRDEICLLDGKVFDRYSAPMFGADDYYHGRVWYFRDVTERKKAEDEILRQSGLVRSLLDSIPDFIFIKDINGVYLGCNPTFTEFVGLPKDEIIGKTDYDLFDKEIADFFREHDRRMMELGKSRQNEESITYPDGRKAILDTLKTPYWSPDGKLVGIIGVSRNITERKKAEEALVDREQRYRLLWESASEAFCLHELVMDANGKAVNYKITDVNPIYEDILGLKASDVIGKLATEAYNTNDPPFMELYAKVALTGISEHFEATFHQVDENLKNVDRHFSISVFSPSPGQFATAFSDISERKMHEDILAHQATHDSLTGLPNRIQFTDALSKIVSSKRKAGVRVAVLFIDLDKFKYVNDTLGHDVGDMLLVEVSKRLRLCLREDDLLCRMGGDEFTVIMKSAVDTNSINTVANRMLTELARFFIVSGNEINIGASIGVSIYPQDGVDVASIIRMADTAMYRAKELGRNNCQLYSSDMDAANIERMRIERELRAALMREELEVYYQPRIDPLSGVMLGAEAQIHWNHPLRGHLMPDEFINIAEECGIIIQVENIVAKNVCSRLKEWIDAKREPITIAINLSDRQLRKADFEECIENNLNEYDIPASSIAIEVSGASLMSASKEVLDSIRKLQLEGMRVILDDFSKFPIPLASLRQLPIDSVKIDGKLLCGLSDSDWNSASIAASITATARNMGLELIAVGVETQEQMNFVTSLMSDLVQGNFIGYPLKWETFVMQVVNEQTENANDNIDAA